jgi:SNF2 family DNA or RNA helicase
LRLEQLPHQRREYEDHWRSEARALLWQMRTGKSKATVDKAMRLRTEGLIDAVLVLAPKGVHSDWANVHLSKHAWKGVPYYAHVWRSTPASAALGARHDKSLERLFAYRDGLAVFCVNSESIVHDRIHKVVSRFLRRRRVMLVCDESDDFRSPSSTRSRRARGFRDHCAFRQILTGTPVANSPLHAWAQFEILQREALGFKNFGDFKARYAEFTTVTSRGGRTFPQLAGYQHLEELRASMARFSSVVTREDVPGLPHLLPIRREVEPSPEAARAYEQLRKELVADIEGERVTEAADGGKRLIKLQQCLSGFVIGDDGVARGLGAVNPRLVALVREVADFPGKSLVWCQFHYDVRAVVAALEAEGIRSVEYHGLTSAPDRAKNEGLFRSDPGVRVMVGTASAGGRGKDFSSAGQIVWYSHTPNLVTRDQGSERATVMGGLPIPVVDLVVPGTVEDRFLAMLQVKRDVADALAGSGLGWLLRELREAGL